MTTRGRVRSLNARLARLEDRIVEPQGPIEYRVMFHDGTPVWPRPDDGTTLSSGGEDTVYRIAAWEDFGLVEGRAGNVHHPGRANVR